MNKQKLYIWFSIIIVAFALVGFRNFVVRKNINSELKRISKQLEQQEKNSDTSSVNNEISENSSIPLFWGNNTKDPDISCEKVFATERLVKSSSKEEMPKEALKSLLLGPTEEEKAKGYYSLINSGVTILSFSLDNSIAKVDFDSKLEEEVAGSCKVSMIRAQITQTLLSFDYIKDIVISVNGKTEDILQP